MTKKILLGVIIVIFLMLDWAALHDIIKRKEPNYWGEYAPVFRTGTPMKVNCSKYCG